MIAMQYEVTLPADYDMNIIRRRVETKGRLTDALPGLGLKAYLIRERGMAGSPINQYAPFYLWRSPEGMAGFLGGEGFAGLCASFGRPRVSHAIGLAFSSGPGSGQRPQSATRRVVSLAPDQDAAEALSRARGECSERREHRALHSIALALEPRSWRVVEFALWTTGPLETGGAPDSTLYRVLHLSTPEYGALAQTAFGPTG